MIDHFSVYIHIPFCAKKCAYCDFVSYDDAAGMQQAYFTVLGNEMRQKQSLLNKRVDTVYIGGGTPSFVDAKYIAQTINALRKQTEFSKTCEITIESNPHSLTKDKLNIFRDCGVNRFSVGVQSFSDDELTAVGRSHSAQDARRAIQLLNSAHIANFSLDVMFSLPLQTLKSWTETLREAADSGAGHISAYGLTLEEHTPLYGAYRSGKYVQDDALDREMYHAAAEILAQNGFRHYEISNYAKQGRECLHNMYCWAMQPYIGLGAAAHSYADKKRFHNEETLAGYLRESNHMAAYQCAPPEDIDERTGDFVMLALRRLSGVSADDFYDAFGMRFETRYASQIEKWTRAGMLSCADGCYALTNKGLDFASVVMRDFI